MCIIFQPYIWKVRILNFYTRNNIGNVYLQRLIKLINEIGKPVEDRPGFES